MVKRIAVLTSGGDAAGMNAAIRAVARTALAKGWEVLGVGHGFAGLLAGQITPLGPRDVGGIIHQGGTFLRTARCPEFMTDDGRRRGVELLQRRAVDGLKVTTSSHHRAFLVEVMGRDRGYPALMAGLAGGAEATECLARGEHGVLVGLRDGAVSRTPLAEAVGNKKTLDPRLLDLARVLAH